MNGFLAEVRKLRTIRTTWVLTIMGWALVALSSSAGLFSGLTGAPFTGSDVEISNAVGAVGGSSMIVLIVALLSMTTEFRHHTIGRTLQITPSRTRMLAAKFAVGAAYALLYFLTSLLLVGLLVMLARANTGASVTFGPESMTALWQGPVALVLNAAFGVALGALIRSQVVAITGTLVWLFLVENLVAALKPEVGKWLPFQALNSLFIPAEVADAGAGAGFALLRPEVALAVFLSYVLVTAVVAGTLLRRRDV